MKHDAAGMAILEKSAAIVAALEDMGEATVQELAARVGEPVSSTYRLLASLTKLEWVEGTFRRGHFRLGVRLVRIGSRLEDRLNVRDACRPFLEQLRQETQATAFLCFLRNDAAVCVERIEGRDVRSLDMRVGDSLPLFKGAAPMAILAYLPEGEREGMLGWFADRRRGGDETVPSDEALRETIQGVRKRGYAISDEDVTPGIAGVGAPLFNHRGELEGAVSVSGLRNQVLLGPPDVAALTVQAANKASRALGFRREVNHA